MSKFLEVDAFSFPILDGADLAGHFIINLGAGAGDARIVDLAAEKNDMVLAGHLAGGCRACVDG